MNLGPTHKPGVLRLSGVQKVKNSFRFLFGKLKRENLVLSKIGNWPFCLVIMNTGMQYQAGFGDGRSQLLFFFVTCQANSPRFLYLLNNIKQNAQDKNTSLCAGKIPEKLWQFFKSGH